MVRSGATIPGQIGPGSDGIEGVPAFSKAPVLSGASASDYSVSLTGLSLGRSYLFAEIQSVYSTAPAD